MLLYIECAKSADNVPTSWPKLSENTALYDCVTVDLMLLNFTYLSKLVSK